MPLNSCYLVRPFQGPKKKWQDKVMGDLCALSATDEWYWLCQYHWLWSELHLTDIDVLANHRRSATCAANIFPPYRLFIAIVDGISGDRVI